MNLSHDTARPHSGLAGRDARHEKRTVVNPPERRETRQTTRKAAADSGFAPQARLTSLLGSQMINDIRRGSPPRKRTCGRKMRLTGYHEIGSHG